uniref:Uncharacterized protein n=1 Tax=Oryza glumipatula TaxID=40148 RepID=A0A0D9Y8S3_9ORYZ
MTGLDSHRAQEAPARPKSPDYRQTRPPHERTLFLDHRKTSRRPKEERSIKEERRLARPEEELRAEDRATKTIPDAPTRRLSSLRRDSATHTPDSAASRAASRRSGHRQPHCLRFALPVVTRSSGGGAGSATPSGDTSPLPLPLSANAILALQPALPVASSSDGEVGGGGEGGGGGGWVCPPVACAWATRGERR